MGPKVIGINLNQGRPLKSFLAHLRSVAKNNQGWSLVKFEDDSVVVTNFYRAMRSRNVYDTLIWWVVVPVVPISWIKPRPRIEYEWNDSTAAKTTRKRDDSFIVHRIVEQRDGNERRHIEWMAVEWSRSLHLQIVFSAHSRDGSSSLLIPDTMAWWHYTRSHEHL